MRMTILAADGAVVIDGRGIKGIDCSSLADGIRVVQWNGTSGHTEHEPDADGDHVANEMIFDIAPFQTIINLWQAAADLIDNPPPPPDPPDAPPMTKEQLVAYANVAQWKRATSGTTVTINEEQIPFPTNPNSMTLINGTLMDMQIEGGATSVNWQIGPTSFVHIEKDDFVIAARAVKAFVQATFDALPALFAEIEAGTITTKAQIDAIFAAF